MKLKKHILKYLIFYLQMLDDGSITDSQGRTVDFKNTVIIMTSNIGSHYLLENKGNTDEIQFRSKQSCYE